jgi:hypothetical protein
VERYAGLPGNETHLIAPEESVTLSILEPIPDMQELGDSMVSDMVRVFLSFIPRKGSSKIQKAHGGSKGSYDGS